jgi:hypothetical protein
LEDCTGAANEDGNPEWAKCKVYRNLQKTELRGEGEDQIIVHNLCAAIFETVSYKLFGINFRLAAGFGDQ